MSYQDIAKVTGQHQLFLGTSSISWTTQQFQQAAQFAKAHDIQSLIVKIADGTNKWYNGLSGYQSIKAVIQAEGVGCIPYTYSYGDKYGGLDSEIDILISYMQDSGVVVADMETEWNGQIGWASHLCSRMQNQSGVFLVSTWADPSLQNWQGVIQALNPCVSAYLPQQYSTSLGGYWQEFGALGAACLQPTLNMTQDFGANDPAYLAKAAHDQGHTAISIWYYETAVANPGLLDQILAAFPKQQEEQPIMIDLNNPIVANYFEATQDSQIWRCKKNGFLLGHGILSFYQKFGGDALCGLTYLGLPCSNELSIDGHPGVSQQEFERATLRYDPQHQLDNPPASGDVYVIHVEQDPRYTALQSQIATLSQPAQVLQQINSSIAQASTSLAEAGTALAQAAKLSQVQ